MKPGPANLFIKRGDDFDFFFRVRARVFDVETGEYVKGDPIDLTGWTGRAQMRKTATSTEVLATFDVDVADQTNPQLLGGVLVSLTRVQTEALVESGVWDIELTPPPPGKRGTYLGGTVTVEQDVTRD